MRLGPILAVFVASGLAFAGDSGKTVYLHVGPAESSIDAIARKHFSTLYQIQDIAASENYYSPPNGMPDERLASAPDETQQCVGGSVLVLYVVSEVGETKDAFVASATSPRLAEAAMTAVARRTYKPARLEGHAVPVIVASRLQFTCP